MQENIQRKAASLARQDDATYDDKHQLDPAGKPTTKPFVKISLRIAPLLTSSKLIEDDERVAHIHAEIAKYKESGIRQLDTLKVSLTAEARKITEHEVRGCKILCAYDYYEVAVDLAGILILDLQKEGSRYKTPETNMDILCHAAMQSHFLPTEENESLFGGDSEKTEHINLLPFTINGADAPLDSWNAYLQVVGMSEPIWTEKVKPQIKAEDEPLIKEVGQQLFDMMKSLTTDLWKAANTVQRTQVLRKKRWNS